MSTTTTEPGPALSAEKLTEGIKKILDGHDSVAFQAVRYIHAVMTWAGPDGDAADSDTISKACSLAQAVARGPAYSARSLAAKIVLLDRLCSYSLEELLPDLARTIREGVHYCHPMTASLIDQLLAQEPTTPPASQPGHGP